MNTNYKLDNNIEKIIVSDKYRNIIKKIKLLQKRLKDSDVKNLSYIETYDKLSKEDEFSQFFDTYTDIFKKVIEGCDLTILASSLYYKDQVERGLLEESLLTETLSKKYLPENLQNDAKKSLKEMKEKGLFN